MLSLLFSKKIVGQILTNHVLDENGYPLLSRAVLLNQLELIELLIEKGANVNITDGLYETPLHKAVAKGRTKAVILLLDGAADVNAMRRDRVTFVGEEVVIEAQGKHQ
ncbi:MAG: ankyrin repeat domain-containing protein [bacterium]